MAHSQNNSAMGWSDTILRCDPQSRSPNIAGSRNQLSNNPPFMNNSVYTCANYMPPTLRAKYRHNGSNNNDNNNILLMRERSTLRKVIFANVYTT